MKENTLHIQDLIARLQEWAKDRPNDEVIFCCSGISESGEVEIFRFKSRGDNLLSIELQG